MCGPGLTVGTIHYHAPLLKPCHCSLVGNWQFVSVRQEQVQALLDPSANSRGGNRSRPVKVGVGRQTDVASKP